MSREKSSSSSSSITYVRHGSKREEKSIIRRVRRLVQPTIPFLPWHQACLFAKLITNVELLGDGLLRFAVCAATLQHAFDPFALVFVFQGYALQSTRSLGLADFLISSIFVNVRQLVDGQLSVGVLALLCVLRGG